MYTTLTLYTQTMIQKEGTQNIFLAILDEANHGSTEMES